MNNKGITMSRISKVVILIALYVTVLGCQRNDTAIEDGVVYHHVLTKTLVLEDKLTLERQFVGVVTPSQNGSIGFELPGKVATILVDAGEAVEKGQPLMTLDTRLLASEQQQLLAQQQQKQFDFELVQTNLKRLKTLHGKGFSSLQSVDEQTARANSLAAQIEQLNAAISANKIMLEQSTLRAPYSGVVDRRLVALGEVVAAGQGVFSLSLKQSIEAQIGVPVRMLAQLTNGDVLPVSVDGQHYQAILITKGSMLDRQTRTVQVRLLLPAANTVFSGQLAYLSLKESIDEKGYWLPMTALTDGLRGLWNVYVAVDSGLQNNASEPLMTIQKRDIRVLYTAGSDVFVNGAVSPGESIVVDGLQRLVPGQTVVLSEVSNSVTQIDHTSQAGDE
jgi:RND family efflux transporter MFP subunit